MPRVLVTGASGFLGAHVADLLARAGWDVLAGGRAGSVFWRLEQLGTPVRRIALDLDDEAETMTAAVRGAAPDVLIHCAAYGVDYRLQEVGRAVRANVEGTIHLVRAAAAAGTGRIVHVGTCYEYGPADRPIGEDAVLAPRSLYGITKAGGALAALGTAATLGAALAVVRPFGMYGPLENATKLVPSLLRACRDGARMELTAGGQRRDYTFVRDIAEACRRLAETASFPAGEVFNLGSGAPVTLRQLGEAAAAVVGHGGDGLLWGALPYRPDEVMNIVADTGKAASLLGWRATTTLADGLAATLAALDAGGAAD